MEKDNNIDNGEVTAFSIDKGKGHFVKVYPERSKHSWFGRLERRVFPKNAIRKHMKTPTTGKEQKDQELRTWRLWKESGIPTLDLAYSNGNTIAWQYLENAPSLGIALESRSETGSIFQNFLDVYTRTRELAKSHNNPDYFHNDPWLKNYIVSNESVIPIDAGTPLNTKLSFEDIDTSLNRITLCGITRLNLDPEKERQYVEAFRETLSPSEARQVINFSFQPPRLARAYWNMRTGGNIYEPTDNLKEKIDRYIGKIFT